VFDPVLDGSIEIVRGRLTDARAEQILGFWSREGALEGAAARERLADVVCVLLDPDGEVAGVNSVYRADLSLIGDRPFWVYRSFLPAAAAGASAEMIQAAFVALEAEFAPTAGAPIGLCVLVNDPAEIAEHPYAEWLWPWLVYAGWLEDGSQVRIRYFAGARVSRPRPVEARYPRIDRRYRVELFAEQTKVDTDAIVDLWTAEGTLPREEAERRVHEVLLVATDRERNLAAVCTVYLAHNEQLGMDMWYLRSFVAPDHRMSGVATVLGLVGRNHLEGRFMSGLDTRGAGMIMEVENDYLKDRFDDAIWFPAYSIYIGDNARGDHVRVHYFPGAKVPARSV
jgi:hypothetical protein